MTADNSHSQRNLGKSINTWVQTLGILVAAAWGVYTFVYKEIKLPKTAPVNISLNLQLKKIGTGVSKGDLTAVEMKCFATNPSSRQIYLLPSAWIAYGIGIAAANNDDANFTKAAALALRDAGNITTVNRHARVEKSSVVAVGRLFTDTMLKPGETTGRTIIFYVHKNDYDLVDLAVVMPSAADVREIQLEWTVTEESVLNPTVYRLDKNGGRTPLREDEYSGKPFDLQQARANAAISLWPE